MGQRKRYAVVASDAYEHCDQNEKAPGPGRFGVSTSRAPLEQTPYAQADRTGAADQTSRE